MRYIKLRETEQLKLEKLLQTNVDSTKNQIIILLCKYFAHS